MEGREGTCLYCMDKLGDQPHVSFSLFVTMVRDGPLITKPLTMELLFLFHVELLLNIEQRDWDVLYYSFQLAFAPSDLAYSR